MNGIDVLRLTKSPCIVGVVVYSQFEGCTDFHSEAVVNLSSGRVPHNETAGRI